METLKTEPTVNNPNEDAVALSKVTENEWVTHLYRVDKGISSTYWGHYFSDYKEALKDFYKRVIEG
jgi:hypothetical protein